MLNFGLWSSHGLLPSPQLYEAFVHPRASHIALPLEPEEKFAAQPPPPGSIPPRSPLPRVIIPSLIFFRTEWPSFPSHRCLLKCHMKTWLKWKLNAFPTYCSFPLEKALATHSSTLPWKLPWIEEPGGLQSMGVTKSQTRLSDFTFTFHFHALEQEMATHSSIFA